MKHFFAEAGQGTKYHIIADAVQCGSDFSVSIVGGSNHHVGAVSLAVYEPIRDSATVSTMTVHTHRDDSVTSMFAKEFSKALKCTVTVSAGIHVDNATREDISILQINIQICLRTLINKVAN